MVRNIFKVFFVINVLIGVFLIVLSFGNGPDITTEKSPLAGMISLIWAGFFFVAAYGVFFMKLWVRKFVIGLYGTWAFFIVVGFILLVVEKDKIYSVLPGAVFSIYLLLFAFFIAPVVFMLHREVKEEFRKTEDEQKKSDEEAARATFKDRT